MSGYVRPRRFPSLTTRELWTLFHAAVADRDGTYATPRAFHRRAAALLQELDRRADAGDPDAADVQFPGDAQ